MASPNTLKVRKLKEPLGTSVRLRPRPRRPMAEQILEANIRANHDRPGYRKLTTNIKKIRSGLRNGHPA